jgi:hypothetical protein
MVWKPTEVVTLGLNHGEEWSWSKSKWIDGADNDKSVLCSGASQSELTILGLEVCMTESGPDLGSDNKNVLWTNDLQI